MTDKGEGGDWVSEAKRENLKPFSELDVLLRALDRFFNIENHTVSSEDLASRNFYEEMLAVRDTILRTLSILEAVIPDNRKNIYWFQKFAETKLLDAGRRDDFRESIYIQDTPEKALYLLYDSFINLKGVISDILRSGAVSYQVFMSIGRMISKDVRENRYFNPFLKKINPEFDQITNQRISDIVKSIQQKDVRQYVSAVYLSLFRFLRFLGYVEIETQRSSSLYPSLLVLTLLRSEITLFQGAVGKITGRTSDPELSMVLTAISYQFAMEQRRVFLLELRDIYRRKGTPQFRGKIENSHGVLKNLTEQCVIQLTQYFSHDIKGEDIFSSFETKMHQSVRLREDVVALHRLLGLVLSKTDDIRARLKLFESLRNYMVYFESFTFRLLRYDDYEEFAHFFKDVYALKKTDIAGPAYAQVKERLSHFVIFIETTLRQLANRSELSARPVDMGRVEELIGQYM